MRRVNIASAELEDPLDLHGFHHAGLALTELVGSRRIGASIYGTDVEKPTGPFHYHHGVEEWVYVIAGAPALRDHEGQRRLAPGDLVCFPTGPAGTHTFHGPGRYVVFSTGTHREPWMSVYPDSGKVGGPEGILLASSAVDYWHGEGTSDPSSEPEAWVPEPRPRPRCPIVNVHAVGARAEAPEPTHPPGFRARRARLGGALNAEMLGATLYELDPSEGTAPYHYEQGREEWLLVLAGRPTLRHPGGEDTLEPGDLVCFPEGPDGAHRVVNRGADASRVLILSTQEVPVTAHYPDSGKLLIRDGDDQRYVFRKADTVDYWDGEA